MESCSLGSSTTGMGGAEDWERWTTLSWKEFFRNPSKCRDKRSKKQNTAQPKFGHELANEPLWTASGRNPSCAREEVTRRSLIAQRELTVRVSNPNTVDSLSPALIWACCKNKDLRRGTAIHSELRRRGLFDNKYSDALIAMYANCGELQKAQTLLDMHNTSNVIPWTALIAGYSREKQAHKALNCFDQMQIRGVLPNEVTYSCILKACAVARDLDKGIKVHNEILRQGLLKHNIVLGGALVDMYAKCRALHQAQSVLEKLPSRNTVCWNALIAGYSQNQQGQQALDCFERMQGEGIHPCEVTYVFILKACAAIGAISKGKEIHDKILKHRLLEHHTVLGGALVDMYAKCGALRQARSVLEKLPSRDVVSWGALVAGYAENNQGERVLDCLKEMQSEGILPDEVIYTCMLKACATTGAVEKGKEAHAEILRLGLLEHDIVLGSALVDMYAKCGALCEAQCVLEKLALRDVVSWGALIAGYTENKQGEQALACFEQMQCEGIVPDEVTYTCILRACGTTRAIDKGRKIHDEISRQGLLENHVVLSSALIDMYAKCGALEQAQNALGKLTARDAVCWSALIAGYNQNGQAQQALDCFEQMINESIVPNETILCCVLNSCSHLGLVEKGQELFDSMGPMYGLRPSVGTFTCMVDLFGRAGHLLKAAEVIQGMPVSVNSAIWHCLLGACRKWADVDVGTWAFERAVELDKLDVPAYVLMSSIYTAAGMSEKAKDIEAMRIQNEASNLRKYTS